MSNLEIIASYRPTITLQAYQQAGATAVVCSLTYDSTRSSYYCSWEEAKDVIEKAHQLDMKAYLLVNRIYTEAECVSLQERMNEWLDSDVDGIYYSDPALYMMALEKGEEHRLIYNQDTVLTNSFDVQSYCDLGIKRCMISHEITLEETLQMLDKVKGELEYVVFGHMNLSYSKRQLISCYFDEVNLNKDTHKVYEIEEESRKERFLVVQDEQGTHIFTKDILDVVDEMKDMMAHGLHTVRVDGVFLTEQQLISAISHVAMGNENKEACWKDTTFTKGYLYQKTNISK